MGCHECGAFKGTKENGGKGTKQLNLVLRPSAHGISVFPRSSCKKPYADIAMENEKPISLKQSIKFLPKDLLRIKKAIHQRFWEITCILWEDDKYFPRGKFFPYKRNKSCWLWVTVKGHPTRKFNIYLADQWLRYLGFEKKLREALLKFYNEHLWDGPDWHPSWKASIEEHKILRKLGSLFFDELTGEWLKEVLTFEPNFKGRWEQQLQLCGLTWDDVHISPYVAAYITSELFIEVHNIKISKRELKEQFRRLGGGEKGRSCNITV